MPLCLDQGAFSLSSSELLAHGARDGNVTIERERPVVIAELLITMRILSEGSYRPLLCVGKFRIPIGERGESVVEDDGRNDAGCWADGCTDSIKGSPVERQVEGLGHAFLEAGRLVEDLNRGDGIAKAGVVDPALDTLLECKDEPIRVLRVFWKVDGTKPS